MGSEGRGGGGMAGKSRNKREENGKKETTVEGTECKGEE